jgi:hypothetical protein
MLQHARVAASGSGSGSGSVSGSRGSSLHSRPSSPSLLNANDYREARYPGLGRPMAPQRAHMRGVSVGAVPENVLRETTPRQRNVTVMGGGSLQGLWNGMRRGSQ